MLDKLDEKKRREKVKSLYFEVFETLFHDSLGQQKEIQRITTDKLPALGYYTLAKLMQTNAFNTVITTNFDDLIQDALIYSGEKRARVITHQDLAFFIERNETPLLCKIHGDAHFRPFNSKENTKQLPEALSTKLETLFDNARVVFIGYGGNDESIFNFLKTCKNISQVYWLNGREPDNVAIKEWWTTLNKKVFVKEYDFDRIMASLRSKFSLEEPNFENLAEKLKSSYDNSLAEETKDLENKEDKSAFDYFLLGNNLYNEGQYEEAIASYKKAIKINPKDDGAYNNMGVIYAALEKYEEAIASYKKAIEINPKYDKAYNNMGSAYDMLEKYEKAIVSYKKAIEISPKYDKAYNNMGSTYDELEKYEEAIASYKKAIEINPKYDVAYNNMGIVHAKVEEYEEAIAVYKKAIEINPKDGGAYNNLFECYVIQNNTMDKVLEDKYTELFKEDKKIFINYEMLKILQDIEMYDENKIDAWKEKYKDVSFGSWSFDELDAWIAAKEEKKKSKLQEVIKIFKSHLK